MKKVKIDIISGFLGAGKTTLIKKLLEEALVGENVVLIENEFGEIGIDGTILKNIAGKYVKYEVDGITIIDDSIFADWYTDLYDNLDCFTGKKYQYLAQVYSMEGFKENQFLAGRYFMICCAADLTGYGIMCESDERSELKEDQWITVTGTIGQYEYDETLVPILTEVTISKAEAPELEYIYYNN